ncbi:50S ribosomal protein L4 [Candidatus Phytoplasma mali]|uniref:Large ribosomal subunit protein uL4 n=2 Tax=cellular organisms TaxID=131567 RepID=RL4_PHYMT|nr:50S ribosomal protein L4 [Candidatus Phytoplasma mali]B3QZZ2.1 RecName: Full=Large ribosomal subunit protein uL4; AltName: Full=50S ribosomal protein L4 [Candidatus Phytoplasma mali AT]CAP18529.1 50S ribosomal protein L4 [Candidatus Phytoplasma mali]
MPKYNLINQKGDFLSQIDLDDEIFGISINKQVLYDVVNAQRASMRQGTHATKNRALVSGGGKKPWRQKGTGRARHGTIRSPLWRGGGVAFGPSPRDYSVKVNQKVRRLALKMALSWKINNKNLILIDNINLETHKTKEFQNILDQLNIQQKTLILTKDLNHNLCLSIRNLSKVLLETVSHVSVYQLLSYSTIILTKEAANYFEENLK